MSLVIAGQVKANIVGLPQSYASDVDKDSSNATQGDLCIQIPPSAGVAGFITVSPMNVSATLANLVNGPCTITISQGAGTLNTVTSQ